MKKAKKSKKFLNIQSSESKSDMIQKELRKPKKQANNIVNASFGFGNQEVE